MQRYWRSVISLEIYPNHFSTTLIRVSVGMMRERILKTNASPTGRQCPTESTQWKPCPPIPCYKWITGSWSHCQLHVKISIHKRSSPWTKILILKSVYLFQGGSCGHGVTNRNITCMRQDDFEPVDNVFCTSPGEHPTTWEHCFIPCNNDCQLSQWSEWSTCHGDCKKDRIGYQTRSRTVLRPPPLSVGKACPEPLWETRDCDIGPCPEYEWKVTDTGEVICQRSDGVTSESKKGMNATKNIKHLPSPAKLKFFLAGCDHSSKPSTKCIYFEGRCLCTENIVFKAINGNCPEHMHEVEALIYSQREYLRVFTTLTVSTYLQIINLM